MSTIVRFLSEINPLSRTGTTGNEFAGTESFGKEESKITYSIRTVISAYLVYGISLVIGEALIIAGSMLFGYNATDRMMPTRTALLCSYFGYIVVIAAFILFATKVNRIRPADIGMGSNIRPLIKGILLGVVSLAVIMGILLACGFVRFEGIARDVDILVIILFFFGYLIQSSMEEIICRGYIFHRLKERNSVLVSALISILFFSVFHFSILFEEGVVTGLIGVANLILISVIFTLLTLHDHNIYSAIGFHWIWNFMLYNVIGLNLSGNEVTDSLFRMSAVNDFFTGGSYGIESGIITTAVLGVVLAVMAIMGKGRTDRDGI